jgi:hypothetical protein
MGLTTFRADENIYGCKVRKTVYRSAVRAPGSTDRVRLRKLLHYSLNVPHGHSPNHCGAFIADDVSLLALDADVETAAAISSEVFVWNDQ